MPKKTIRRKMLARRSAIEETQWRISSIAAEKRLLELPVFRQASSVALYSPFRNEVDTRLIFEACRGSGKRTYYPVVCEDRLVFREIAGGEQLVSGSFGIMEPCGDAALCMQPEEIELMVVPGVAFDLYGHRLGYGKGYYDRFFSGREQHTVLIGLCHDFQICGKLPAEQHDIRMNHLVTELRVISLL